MSAVTQNEYTGNGSTTTYSFTFPYLKTSDIKASLDAVATTAFTLANATTLQFNTAPANGVKIKIFRETGVDNLTATFYAGSAIKSEDLNDNFTQNLFVTQEVNQRYLSTLGGTMTGDLALGEDAKIIFEGATDDAHETTLTVADPTADRTITIPNVSGNVVTTGDTGTVTSTMLADGTIVTADLADDAVRTAKILDGNVTTAKLGADSVTGAKIADDQINSEHYVNASIDTDHIADSQITNAKMADNSVNTTELVDDAVTAAKLASNSVVSASIVDESIVTNDIADNAITNAKMADNSVGAAELVSTSVGTAALASDAVTLAKMADNSVGTSEIVDDAVTTVKIANDQVTTAKILDSNVTTTKINNDAITSAKIADNAVGNEHLQDDSVRTPEIQDAAVTANKLGADAVITAKIQDNAVTTAKIADAELTTLAGMQSGTASKLADSTALTSDIADLNQIDGLTKQTTISDSDASFPTSGAVVDYVAAQISPLGGLEVIATEVAFPNTQPSAGVVISISDAGGVVFNGSGTSTTGRTVGGSTVTINNAPSSLNSETLVAGVGLMVSSTGSGQIYNYHKILGKEDDIKQLSDDINDFNARYRVGSSNPTSALDAGDLFFNTSTSKLLVYNATNSAWEEAQSIGNFFISTLSPAFDNNTQNFTITNAPTNAEQILLSINGVVQKPNAGTSTPSEGFALDGSTVKLSAAPPTGSIYHAVVLGSTVNIGTPSNNTVTTAILQNSSVTTAKIADDAVTGAKIADNLDIPDNNKIRFGAGNDLQIYHDGTDNHIVSTNGQINIQTNSTENAIQCIPDGQVKLFHDNTLQVSTSSTGIAFGDSKKANFGGENDLQIYHDGSNSYIDDSGTGNLLVRGNNIELHKYTGEDYLKCIANGAVELYYDNVKKLETTSDGTTISGDLTIDGSTPELRMKVTDDAQSHRIRFFNAADSMVARIFGDPATGNLSIQTGSGGAEEAVKCISNGAVELYHNNSKKLDTDSEGISVTGTVKINNTSSVGDYNGGADDMLIGTHSGNHGLTILSGTSNGGYIMFSDNNGGGTNAYRGQIEYAHSSDYMRFITDSGERVRILSGGGITFNGDTATANALDDYEEGSFTPSYPSGSGGGNMLNNAAYTNTQGYYTKIGGCVTFSLRIQCSSHTVIGGHVIINGLPYANGANNGKEGGAFFNYSSAVDTTNSGNRPTMHISNNATAIGFYTSSGAAFYAGAGGTNWNNTLHITGVYHTF